VISGYVPVGGLDLYYEDHGSGPPLVLLHGALGTIESCFAELLPRLAARRRVIAVELQGHGHTPDIDRPLSYDQMSDDAAAVAEALGVTPADFVGYSMGGAVALGVAMRHPHLVRRVVDAGGASFAPDGLYPELLEGEADLDDLAGSPWEQAYLRVAPDPSAWPALVAKNTALDQGFTGWTADEVRSVTAPVLLLIGDSDLVRPEHTVEMFRLLGGGVFGDLAGLPDSQLAVLPGTSHVGVLERTDWLESMILGFLDPEELRG
jgi:pimeloyl-ACP methyl ester carboxylesterase